MRFETILFAYFLHGALFQVHGARNCTYASDKAEYTLVLQQYLTLERAIESCKLQGMSLVADDKDMDIKDMVETVKTCDLFDKSDTYIFTWLNTHTNSCKSFYFKNGNGLLKCHECRVGTDCSGRMIDIRCAKSSINLLECEGNF